MQANVTGFVVGAFGLMVLLAGSAAVSVALPLKAVPGQTRCQCGCQTAKDSKDLDWAKTGSCNSNGKNCSATFDSGKTLLPGKLVNCAECKAEDGGWRCVPVSAISGGMRLPSGSLGTFQRQR